MHGQAIGTAIKQLLKAVEHSASAALQSSKEASWGESMVAKVLHQQVQLLLYLTSLWVNKRLRYLEHENSTGALF